MRVKCRVISETARTDEGTNGGGAEAAEESAEKLRGTGGEESAGTRMKCRVISDRWKGTGLAMKRFSNRD